MFKVLSKKNGLVPERFSLFCLRMENALRILCYPDVASPPTLEVALLLKKGVLSVFQDPAVRSEVPELGVDSKEEGRSAFEIIVHRSQLVFIQDCVQTIQRFFSEFEDVRRDERQALQLWVEGYFAKLDCFKGAWMVRG